MSEELISRAAVMDAVCAAVADWFDAGQKGALSVLLIDAIDAVPALLPTLPKVMRNERRTEQGAISPMGSACRNPAPEGI